MSESPNLEKVAELFRALGAVSRLRLLATLSSGEGTVGSLVQTTGLSQPLVSQHLRVLRSLNLVSVNRSGREAIYALSDQHVAHVINDAIAHADEAFTTTT